MKFTITVIFALTVLLLSAQKDTSIYKTIRYVERNEYIFSIPEKWKEVPQKEELTRDEKFEFTDVALPHLINDAPLTAFFILTKMPCDNVDTAVNTLVKEFTSYPDRITQAGEDYTIDSITIKSGEKAYFISSRFYRRSKVSNFSLYELAVYSPKNKAAYLLTITYRYKDATYQCEADYRFKDYALRIFKSLVLR